MAVHHEEVAVDGRPHLKFGHALFDLARLENVARAGDDHVVDGRVGHLDCQGGERQGAPVATSFVQGLFGPGEGPAAFIQLCRNAKRRRGQLCRNAKRRRGQLCRNAQRRRGGKIE